MRTTSEPVDTGTTRRHFLAASGVLASTFAIVPRPVLGGAGYTAPSDKVTIAFIGVGSQGLRVMLSFLKEPGVQAVAVCDPNCGSGDYPQWGKSEFASAVHSLYLPFVWRGWHDFGSGALGDMGHYSFDTIFRVLKLEAPTSVQASSTDRFAETFPRASIIHFDFPARGDLPPVTLTWYDSGLKPPRPEGLAAGSALEDEGLMFLGDHGTILCEFNGRHPRIIPESRMKEFQQPPRTLPRSPGILREWLDACKGSKTRPGASFEFSGPVVESLQLGNVALRKGREVVWDRAGLKAVDDGEAQRTINPERRARWAV